MKLVFVLMNKIVVVNTVRSKPIQFNSTPLTGIAGYASGKFRRASSVIPTSAVAVALPIMQIPKKICNGR